MDVRGITINSKGSRSMAMSVWADIDARGWTVTVCVADVACAISKDSIYDKTAKRRGETAEIGRVVRPLLPRRFGEGACSLVAGLERPVMAMRIRLDHDMDVRSFTVDKSTLRTDKNLNYEDVSLIEEDTEDDLGRLIHLLSRLAHLLIDKRIKSKAFAFYDKELSVLSEENGLIKRVNNSEFDGILIVQELSILANFELAKFCIINNIPAPLRVQKPRISSPDRESIIERVELGMLGRASDLDSAKSHMEISMEPARYSAAADSHYALNLPSYAHGTDPISRYADLVLQRQVMSYVSGSKIVYGIPEILDICGHVNSTADKKIIEIEGNRNNDSPSASAGTLAHLSKKEFDKVLENACRGSFNPYVADAFISRLKNNQASIASMHCVLLKSSNWTSVQFAVIEFLKLNPHVSSSIVSMAKQLNGWSAPSFKERRGGDGNIIMHSSQVFFRKPGIESDLVSATNKKLARQLAVVDALLKFAINKPNV